MKSLKFFLSLFISLFLSLLPSLAFADTNSFYFEDATFDYYLSSTETGASTMQVEESLTAVFPTYAQNHGIIRCIPYSYRGVKSLDESSFSVTRNGVSEPFTTYQDDSLTCLRIGSANSYVTDKQVYNISYVLNNVILAPDNSPYQELYWDTNGTEWSQPFYSLTANIHLSDPLINAWNGETSCYVGAQGAGGSDAMSRCETSISEDKSVITFSSENLAPRENLTFDLRFMPETFYIKKSPAALVLAAIGGIVALILGFSGYKWYRAEKRIKEKKKLAKEKIVPVQYTPPKDLTVAEAGTAYLKSTKDLKVATLMELAIKHHIELKRGEKKVFGGYHWIIHVKNTTNLTSEQTIVLEILNGGNSVHDGDSIEVKRHTATTHLEKLGHDFDRDLKISLKSKGLFEEKKSNSSSSKSAPFLIFFILVIAFGFIAPIILKNINFTSFFGLFSPEIQSFLIVGGFFLFMIYIITLIIISTNIHKYKERTLEGIKVTKYLDGLKEYMTLAEKDRLKFLQSVKGVDTSNQGIVKLYEKLLPYAVLFGVEESWMDELSKYYKLDDVSEPYWMYGAYRFSANDFRAFSSYASSSISSSVASSSSGSSGGGGGGFSGGGGGGGGGGGW